MGAPAKGRPLFLSAVNLRAAFEVFRTHGYGLGPEDEPTIVGRHPIDYVPDLARSVGVTTRFTFSCWSRPSS